MATWTEKLCLPLLEVRGITQTLNMLMTLPNIIDGGSDIQITSFNIIKTMANFQI